MFYRRILQDQKSRPLAAARDPLAERLGVSKRMLDAIYADEEARNIFHPRHIEDTTRLRSLVRRAMKSPEVFYSLNFIIKL